MLKVLYNTLPFVVTGPSHTIATSRLPKQQPVPAFHSYLQNLTAASLQPYQQSAYTEEHVGGRRGLQGKFKASKPKNSAPKSKRSAPKNSAQSATSCLTGLDLFQVNIDLFPEIDLNLFDLEVGATKGDFTVELKNEQKIVTYKKGTAQEINFSKDKDGVINAKKDDITYKNNPKTKTLEITKGKDFYKKTPDSVTFNNVTIPTTGCPTSGVSSSQALSSIFTFGLVALSLAVATL